jgi:hypothetical protein
MADVRDVCKQGHGWDYSKGTCMFCGKGYEEYKQEMLALTNKGWGNKCECGSEVEGSSSGHSHWCPKASK